MKDETQTSGNSDVKKLGELIKDVKVAMLTTLEADGSVHSRPMMTQETEFDGDLWFFTGKNSGKTRAIKNDQKVNVAYSSPEHSRYVSIYGTAEMIDDRQKAEELWKPVYKAWFPKGLEDPDLCLLKVNVKGAEYWDSPSGAMVQLVGFAKALLTGERYKPGPGEHEKIDVRH